MAISIINLLPETIGVLIIAVEKDIPIENASCALFVPSPTHKKFIDALSSEPYASTDFYKTDANIVDICGVRSVVAYCLHDNIWKDILPEKKEGVIYIVPEIVAWANSDREDLYYVTGKIPNHYCTKKDNIDVYTAIVNSRTLHIDLNPKDESVVQLEEIKEPQPQESKCIADMTEALKHVEEDSIEKLTLINEEDTTEKDEVIPDTVLTEITKTENNSQGEVIQNGHNDAAPINLEKDEIDISPPSENISAAPPVSSLGINSMKQLGQQFKIYAGNPYYS